MTSHSISDDIYEAMVSLGGESSLQEVSGWINRRYPGRWKDVGTSMADLTYPGNRSSNYPKGKRFLERVGHGRYRLRSINVSVDRKTSQNVSTELNEQFKRDESAESQNYIINTSKDDGRLVELWSCQRLPFEPKDWLLRMRNDLKSALKNLHASDKSILYAVYQSVNKYLFDVENVLIYNVGTGSFSHLCRRGLIFERRFLVPPSLPDGELSEKLRHYHKYQIMNDESLIQSYWGVDKVIANWTNVPCVSLRGDIKPHHIWYDMKMGNVNIENKMADSSYCGISVIINVPDSLNINIANIIKPLLDGIVSAFHVYNGTAIHIVSKWLAEKLNQDQEAIESQLLDPKLAVLGKRQLIHPFGKGIQWNPADDALVKAKVLINIGTRESVWSHSGELFTLKKK